MFRYKIRAAGPGIAGAVICYLVAGLVFDEWHGPELLAFCLGLFISAPDYHPNLVQSAGDLRLALSEILDQVLRDQSARAESVSIGGAPAMNAPTRLEIERAEYARTALCRHIALEYLSTIGRTMHRDYLRPGD